MVNYKVTQTCVGLICDRLNCTEKDIDYILVGGTMFIVGLKSGATATIDYSLSDVQHY